MFVQCRITPDLSSSALQATAVRTVFCWFNTLLDGAMFSLAVTTG